jgi:inorganic triphosphatase YgiF
VKREIELKYTLSGPAAARDIEGAGPPEGMSFGSWDEASMTDVYCDTEGRALFRRGFALRLRFDAAGVLATVKELRPAEGPLHARNEYEQRFTRTGSSAAGPGSPLADSFGCVDGWPEGEVKTLLLAVTGPASLVELFRFFQTRLTAPLLAGGETAAEVSLDRVEMKRGGRTLTLHEMEVEVSGGESGDTCGVVTRWVDSLGRRVPGGLKPDRRSKFEKAREFFDIPLDP